MYTKLSEKEQSTREPVYDQNKEYFPVLHQILVDMKEDSDRALKQNWGIPYKDLKSCNIKTHTNGRVELLVSEFHGGFRVPECNNLELQNRAKDTKKLLKDFESALKQEFKSRTGKAFKLKDVKEGCDYQLVAPNGLYRFVAIKSGIIDVNLDGQEYKESLKDV